MFAKKRHQEKALMKKTIAMHEEKEQKHKADDGAPQNAVPAYLLERDQVRKPLGGSRDVTWQWGCALLRGRHVQEEWQQVPRLHLSDRVARKAAQFAPGLPFNDAHVVLLLLLPPLLLMCSGRPCQESQCKPPHPRAVAPAHRKEKGLPPKRGSASTSCIYLNSSA